MSAAEHHSCCSWCVMTRPLIINSSHFLLRCASLRRALFCIQYGKDIEFATSSLRVDRVAAHGLALSRRNVDLAFLSNLLYLNGILVKKKSIEVKTGDVIDLIRKDECTKDLVKFDSVKLLEMLGKTAKGKEKVLLSRKRGVILDWDEFKGRFK